MARASIWMAPRKLVTMPSRSGFWRLVLYCVAYCEASRSGFRTPQAQLQVAAAGQRQAAVGRDAAGAAHGRDQGAAARFRRA